MCWDYQLNKPAIKKLIILVAFFPFLFTVDNSHLFHGWSELVDETDNKNDHAGAENHKTILLDQIQEFHASSSHSP